jgi:GTPase SAR1 family protein
MAKASSVKLQSQEHRDLLDIIDRLRSHGISRYIDLPEIIVCGDQSAGKSSILEGISGMSFPAKDNVCTRFATEVVLRRSATMGVNVSITPGPERTKQERDALAKFSPPQVDLTTNDGKGLATVVDLARDAMGLGAPDSKGFSADVLKVEISGPNQPNLTMVDLPGLFRASNSDQKASDAPMVKSMVEACMKRPRSIILAVVSARSDFSLQEVTEMARELDPQGARTLGLITKPDTLDEGSDSEASYLNLALNRDVVLKLGWHVVKNRSYAERNYTNAERNASEERFFKRGVWADLDRNILGVTTLRTRLSNVLKDQILSNLPSLTRDVREGIDEVSAQILSMGMQRATISEQRRYLCQFAEKFTSLIKAAEEGAYHDPFFGIEVDGFSRRLRAEVRQELDLFTEEMHSRGEAQVIVDEQAVDESPVEIYDTRSTKEKYEDPRITWRQRYLADVEDIIRKDRGRELPGLFNPMIVTTLFRKQCQPWREIAERAKDRILDSVHAIARDMAQHVAIAETADVLLGIISDRFESLKEAVDDKLVELLDQHLNGHPITCNRDLLGTVRETHLERQRQRIQTILRYSNEYGEDYAVNQFVEAYRQDLQSYGSSMALDYMQSYYKIAIEHFIDGFSTLAIEHCLVAKLSTLFSPVFVAEFSDEETRRLSAETPSTAAERQRCMRKLEVLERGMSDLRRLQRRDSL